MQFLAQELVMTKRTTYPKFGCSGVIVFELWQILVFHNPIFHVKNIQNQTM
jgi:hypothetical protein